jgi:hypothetical protein
LLFLHIGIDITLTGGQSDVFDGARGYFVFLGDDETYGFDMPIEFKKSADGVIGASISSVNRPNNAHLLASRKNGGIGSAYAEQLRAFYEQQPDTCDMSVINIYF